MNKVANIYDQLFAFESNHKKSFYPIHKKLNFDGQYEDISDWLFKRISFRATDYVLDVGCGTGYTLNRIVQHASCQGLGISISEREIEFASKLSTKAANSDHIQFKSMSFDAPLEETFDKMIAIESLKHSLNIETTLNNLITSLKPNGILLIADDFLIKNSEMSEKHKDLWQVPSFIAFDELKQIILSNGDFEFLDFDLTSRVKLKKKAVINVYLNACAIILRFSDTRFKRNLRTYIGAMLLEKLYHLKQANYKVLIAKKK